MGIQIRPSESSPRFGGVTPNNLVGQAPNQATMATASSPQPAAARRAPRRQSLHGVVGRHDHAGRDPHPVVVPADRASTSSPVTARPSAAPSMPCPLRLEQPGGRHSSRRPNSTAAASQAGSSAVHAAGQPGDEALERLVARPAGEAGPAALRQQPVEPPLGGVWRAGSTKPSSTVKANPAQAMAAWRNFLATSRYGMKMSGVSLTPAAHAAVPKPFHQRVLPVSSRVSGWAQVPQDQGHQDQVDLAQVHGAQDRLGPQDRRGAQQRGADPGTWSRR